MRRRLVLLFKTGFALLVLPVMLAPEDLLSLLVPTAQRFPWAARARALLALFAVLVLQRLPPAWSPKTESAARLAQQGLLVQEGLHRPHV